mgnify:CR=1 FL=1
MSERITRGSENDYHPVNQYIDEQSKLRRARSFWINAKSWALILIAIGFLMVLLAWAYSLLHKHYILKRVAVVQEKVIEEKINDAISSGGISKSVEKLQMLGNNEIAIEKLNEVGANILASGTKGKRQIGQNCRVMIHSVAAGNAGALHDLTNELEAIQDLQDMYTCCLAAETNMTEGDIKDMLNRNVNVYLSATEAVKLGIADIII